MCLNIVSSLFLESMTQIELFEKDGIEVYIDKSTGETFQTVRSLARILGVHHTTISRKVKEKGGALAIEKNAKIPTTTGFKTGALELSKRDKDFAKHQKHLQNTAKKAMRHSTYNIKGEDSVPEELKPKHERKLLNSV